MQGNKTRAQHAALMGRMAATLGADLDLAEMRGALPPERREDMLLSCTGCADPTACAQWLNRTPTAEAAPRYCRNGDSLRALATP